MTTTREEALPFEIAGVQYGEETYRIGSMLWREFDAAIQCGGDLIGVVGTLALHRAGFHPRSEMSVQLHGALKAKLEIGNSQHGIDVLRSDTSSTEMIEKILTSGTAV